MDPVAFNGSRSCDINHYTRYALVPRAGDHRGFEMAKRVLVVLSGYGYWGEELIGPLEALDEAGYEVDFVTPKGTRPVALPPSMDETGKPVAAECYGVACL